MTQPRRIAVIGAGIVGVSCALHLQRDGHSVTLIDQRVPGTSTSFGNAGVIASSAVAPNSTPALRREIPHMLFSRDSAVWLRWRYLPRIAPWLVQFFLAGRRSRVETIADALLPLVTGALDHSPSPARRSRGGVCRVGKTQSARPCGRALLAWLGD